MGNYEEESAKIEKEFNEREAKEANKVDKAYQPKDTETLYKEHLMAQAQEKAQADEVNRIAGLSDEELEREYDKQEGHDCLDCQEEQRKEAGVPWFKKSAPKTILKFG